MALALLAASVPGIHPILQRMFPALFEDRSNTRGIASGHIHGGGRPSYRDPRSIALETVGGTRMTRKDVLDSDSSKAMVLDSYYEKDV